MLRVVFLLLLTTSASAAPRSLTPADEASLLLEQGRRHDEAGRPEVALGLYRAAILLAPDAPEPHRLVAGVLHRQNDCEGALPELRAYMALTPESGRSGTSWDDAVLLLAQCLKEGRARLEVRSEVAAACAVGHGAPRPADPTAFAVFDLPAGEHRLSCTVEAAQTGVEATVALAAGQTRTVHLDASGKVAGTLRLSSPVAALCTVDGRDPFTVTQAETSRLLAPGSRRVDCTCPGFPPFAEMVTIEAAGEHVLQVPFVRATTPRPPPLPEAASVPLPVVGPDGPEAAETASFELPPAEPLVSKEVDLPEVQPELLPAPVEPASPAGGTGRTELEILTEGRGWTCRVGERTLTSNVAGEIFLELPPGAYPVHCERPGAEPVEKTATLTKGERTRLSIEWAPRKATPTPQPVKPPGFTLLPGAIEWRVGGGIGPGFGTFGMAAGGRYGPVSVLLGTGLYPLALSVTHHSVPHGSGLYLTAGWIRVGNGMIGGGSRVDGHGLYGGGGVEVRIDRWAVRVGAGLGWNSAGSASGPFTLDLAAFWLP